MNENVFNSSTPKSISRSKKISLASKNRASERDIRNLKVFSLYKGTCINLFDKRRASEMKDPMIHMQRANTKIQVRAKLDPLIPEMKISNLKSQEATIRHPFPNNLSEVFSPHQHRYIRTASKLARSKSGQIYPGKVSVGVQATKLSKIFKDF